MPLALRWWVSLSGLSTSRDMTYTYGQHGQGKQGWAMETGKICRFCRSEVTRLSADDDPEKLFT